MISEPAGMNRLLLVCCLTLSIGIGLVSTTIADDAILKVFQINYRNAEELETLVQPLLSPEGKAFSDKRTNSLIVKDIPANVKAITEFLKSQDRRPQQVRIRMQYVDESTLKRMGLTIRWKYRDRHWAVGSIAGGRIHAVIGAGKASKRVRGEQSLLVMSGSKGRIAVGRSVPYTDWFYGDTKHRGYPIKGTSFRDVSTGFLVEPRVAGDTIHIVISPRISYLGEHGTDEIIYREASTTITCQDGETVLIGSSDSSSENIVWNIFGGVQESRHESRFYMMLTPQIKQ